MSITLLIIILLIVIYYSYRYGWWKSSVSYDVPRILMYHMVRPHLKGSKFNGLRVDPVMFEKHIQYLVHNGWNFYTMSELIDNKEKLPKKSIAITFDDGYEDNFTNAFPILQKYNVKSTIYLVVDRHNREWSSKRKSKNNTGELVKEPKLTDSQVKTMIESGLLEIGSHTITHDNLSNISQKQKHDEIYKSKTIIEENFNIECNSFCYPFGIIDINDWKLVKEAGYTNATTTEKGIDNLQTINPYLISRVTISGKDNFYAFKLKLRTGKRGVKK